MINVIVYTQLTVGLGPYDTGILAHNSERMGNTNTFCLTHILILNIHKTKSFPLRTWTVIYHVVEQKLHFLSLCTYFVYKMLPFILGTTIATVAGKLRTVHLCL